MSDSRFDVAVVGGGIVGLAVARTLTEHRHLRVIVLEKESQLARHQTGRNSGVIHSGLYYKPGSLKAATCAAGREAMYRFCDEEGIPTRRSGKLVVAVSAGELPRLEQLADRGRANGLVGVRRLERDQLQEYEPNAVGLGGLWVPDTGVVDFRRVAEALARRTLALGGTIRTGARVLEARPDATGITVRTRAGELRARMMVSCAGLHSDRVARRSGLQPEVRIVPFRGEYYELRPDRRDLVRGLIYPVPDPGLPFLGVHFTRRIGGAVDAGPNAVLAWRREGYRHFAFSVRDAVETVAFPGFRGMVRTHWRSGLDELHRSLRRAAFGNALRRLVPAVQDRDLLPGSSGVRAQAVGRNGVLLDDFHLLEAPRMLHVLNAPSPAATASLAIADQIAARVMRQLAGLELRGRTTSHRGEAGLRESSEA